MILKLYMPFDPVITLRECAHNIITQRKKGYLCKDVTALFTQQIYFESVNSRVWANKHEGYCRTQDRTWSGPQKLGGQVL